MEIFNSFRNSLEKYSTSYIIGSFAFLGLYLIKKYFNGPSAVPKSLKGKTVIITGASDGIGYITAKELLEQGANVIFACRNEEKTKKAIEKLDESSQKRSKFVKLNLSSFQSVKEFVIAVKNDYSTIDILINNAGLYNEQHKLTEDNIEEMLQANTFSPMYITQELFPLLEKTKGKVINVSSIAHRRFVFNKEMISEWKKPEFNFLKDDYDGMKSYGLSKLGNIYFTQYFADYIEKFGYDVGVYSLHPGVIPTNLLSNSKLYYILYPFYPILLLFVKSIWYGSQTTLHLCYEEKNKLENGGYYSDCALGKLHPHAVKENKDARNAFIEWSREVINTKGKDKIKLDLDYKY